MTEKMRMAEQALEQGKGILRLAPTWVPRSFCRPGKRIKLHPDDYFILGQRGGIDERWFSSTTWAENGPDTPEDEGLSYVVADEEGKDRCSSQGMWLSFLEQRLLEKLSGVNITGGQCFPSFLTMQVLCPTIFIIEQNMQPELAQMENRKCISFLLR